MADIGTLQTKPREMNSAFSALLEAEGVAVCSDLEGIGVSKSSRRMATLVRAASQSIKNKDRDLRTLKELIFGLTLAMADHVVATDSQISDHVSHCANLPRLASVERSIAKLIATPSTCSLDSALLVINKIPNEKIRNLGLYILSFSASVYPVRYLLMVVIFSPFTLSILNLVLSTFFSNTATITTSGA